MYPILCSFLHSQPYQIARPSLAQYVGGKTQLMSANVNSAEAVTGVFTYVYAFANLATIDLSGGLRLIVTTIAKVSPSGESKR